MKFAQNECGVVEENIQPFSIAGVSVFPQKLFLLRIFVVSPRDDLHFRIPSNDDSFLALIIAPNVVEGEPIGNNTTTLRKGVGFSVYREGSLTNI